MKRGDSSTLKFSADADGHSARRRHLGVETARSVHAHQFLAAQKNHMEFQTATSTRTDREPNSYTPIVSPTCQSHERRLEKDQE